MHAREVETNGNSGQRKDLVVFVLQIGIPAVVVNALTIARSDRALAVFGIPFCDWASIACAIWGLLVIQCGPFATLQRLSQSAKERKYVSEGYSSSTKSGDEGDVLVSGI